MFRKQIKFLGQLNGRDWLTCSRKSLSLLVIRKSVSEGPRPRIFGNFLPFFGGLTEFPADFRHIKKSLQGKTLIQCENLIFKSVHRSFCGF